MMHTHVSQNKYTFVTTQRQPYVKCVRAHIHTHNKDRCIRNLNTRRANCVDKWFAQTVVVNFRLNHRFVRTNTKYVFKSPNHLAVFWYYFNMNKISSWFRITEILQRRKVNDKSEFLGAVDVHIECNIFTSHPSIYHSSCIINMFISNSIHTTMFRDHF